jgi:DNA-binding NarL/FixJ family response regulator
MTQTTQPEIPRAAVMGPLKVALLDDQQLFRESMVALLESSHMQLVAAASDVEEFLQLVTEHKPDVAVVDLRLERGSQPLATEGLDVVERLHDFYPGVRVLVLSGCRDREVVESCFRAGAAGYLCKSQVGVKEVRQALEAVARGETLRPADLFSGPSPGHLAGDGAAHPAAGTSLQTLTPREREVLGYVAVGADNLKIAAHLDITERTVKAHITSLYRKLDVQNRTQMAMLACKLGVARPLES